MINRQRQEIEQIFSKIDKIAKKGPEYFQDYSKLVDELVLKGKYSEFKQCLDIYYSFEAENTDVSTVKKQSWPQVRFYTNSSFQEQRQKLLKSKGVYQVALYYYKEIQLARAVVIDSKGSGAELSPVIIDGGVDSVTILRQGQNYSASASISFIGGVTLAEATPTISNGRITSIQVTGTGSGYNQNIKLGIITEFDVYEEDVTNKFSKDQFERLTKNKTTYLVVTKDLATQSATFSTWNLEYSYDKNILKLYTQAVNYLLS